MRKTKKMISLLMAVGMLVTSVLPSAAFERPQDAEEALHSGYSSTEDAYAIYPIPQSTTYDGKAFTLDTEVETVIGEGIDSYTEDFLSEILQTYGRTEKKSQNAEGNSRILLGIYGSGDAADSWLESHADVKDAELFTRTDAYALSAKDGTIAIVGRNTDAAYYGLATLQMMFSSFAGEKFLNVQIEDYAVMKMRGFIEGFYNAWDYPNRENLMRFARDVKMNTYIYASKTDSYHKNDVLYPEDELAQIRHLAEVGEETKVKYAWSVHISYFFNAISGNAVGSEAYERAFNQKFESLKAKFQQLYDAGVRKFAILNDDFGAGSHSEVVRLLNKLDEEFLQPKGCDNLTYCMQGYNKSWSKMAELTELRNLNESIDLFWTGDDVNSPITQETVDYVKNNTGHEAVFWLNYPVNEHGKAGIYLGNITHYARDGVTGLAGAVSNPSRFAQTNKVGLFQLASLFWNNRNYLEQADTIWEESFKYLQPEVYQAYLTIARNVSNCPNSSRVKAGFPESEYLKDALASVKEKAGKGRKLAGDKEAQAVKAEFSNILEAIEVFNRQCKNTKLVSELAPWLNSLRDVAAAGEAVMQAFFAMEEGDVDTAWANLGAAGKFMETYNTYPSWVSTGPNDNPTIALAGSKRLEPFVSEALVMLKNQILPYLNPASTDFTPSFIGVMGGQSVGNTTQTAKLFDGDTSSYAAFQTVQKLGDYYGVDLGRELPVYSVEILQAMNDAHHDYFHNAALEYSTDGENWTQIGDNYEDAVHIEVCDLDIQARYIRLRLTKVGTASKNDYWTNVREFTVNGGKKEAFGVFASAENLSGQVVLENRTYSLEAADTIALQPGEYVGVKLGELSGLESVEVSGAGVSDLTLQYSVNGAVWKEASGAWDQVTARYVRLYNAKNTAVSLAVESFDVTVGSIAIHPAVTDSSFGALKEGAWENLFDGKESTFAWTNTAQRNGQYILVDLGATAPVYDVTITTEDGKPRFYNAQIQVSEDNASWETIATVTDGGGDAVREDIYYRIRKNLDGRQVRYLKVLITGDNGAYLKINEIAINKTVETTSKEITGTLSGDVEKMIDGDISTVYVSDQVSDGTACMKYLLTENTKVTTLTFLQSAAEITNAVVKAEVYDGKEVREVILGTLNGSSTSFYRNGKEDMLSLTVTWPQGTTPLLYEIISAVGETVHEISFSGEGAPDGVLWCPEKRAVVLPQNTLEKKGFFFKGWSDGTSVYEAGKRYFVGEADVAFTAVWEEDKREVSQKLSDSMKQAEEYKDASKYTPQTWDVMQKALQNAKDVQSNPASTKAEIEAAALRLQEAVAALKPIQTPDPVPEKLKVGDVRENGNYRYKVTNVLPRTVEVIGVVKSKQAKLKKISIGNAVTLDGDSYLITSVSASACKGSKKATGIVIGKYVETIGNQAFAGCAKVKTVKINSVKLKKIGSKAFYQCKKLKSLTIKSKALKSVGKNALKGIDKKAVVKVPSAKLKAYKKLLARKGQSKSVKIKK